MAFSRLVFTVLFLSVSCYASNVPAFLWGDVEKFSADSNPLVTITTPEFRGMLEEQLVSEPFTVLFAEKTLSVEDFSTKDPIIGSPFSYLITQHANSLYLPSVDNPVGALKEIADPSKVDRIQLNEEGRSEEIQSNMGESTFLIVTFEDAKETETRAEMLRRHNDYMKKTVKDLQRDKKSVIAIYTGLNPSWVIPESHFRVRRQASNITQEVAYNLEGLLLYVESIRIQDGNNTIRLDGTPTSNTLYGNDSLTMNTTLTFGSNSFVMMFRQRAGYWFFDSVVLPAPVDEDLLPVEEIYALVDFSYRCGQTVVFNGAANNVSRSIIFENIQIQPFFTTSGNETHKFGDTFDCVGYFSAPIWAGLMVTFLLLSITFFGIMMMMDIRTMDRFDDPKGKTITINTSE